MSPALQYASLNEAWGIKKSKGSSSTKVLPQPAQEDIMGFVEGYEDPSPPPLAAPAQALITPQSRAPSSENGALGWGVISPDVLLYVLSGFLLILMMEQVLQLGARLAAAGARSVRLA